MTISGKLTQRQRTFEKLVKILACLTIGVGGFWFMAAPVLRLSPLNNPFTIALAALYPVAGVVAYGLLTWSSGWRVVEFSCDESALTYRKARSARARTRPLSDVVKVEEARGAYGTPIGYQVNFRDGEEILLGRRLPHAKELADWLSAHR
jgi:hypothetical protein